MNVGQLLRAIENLRAHGLKDDHLVSLQVFQEKPGAVAEGTLDTVNLIFEENWRSTTDPDAPKFPYLMLTTQED